MPNDIALEQKKLRQEIRIKRNNLSAQQQQQATDKVLSRLIKHPKILQAKSLSLTLAYDGELDLMPFIDWCWQQQKNIYVPVIDPDKKGKLLFLAYKETTEIIKNRYGIEEPALIKTQSGTGYLNSCESNDLDIILTPLVAFDQHGNRMGMGGGYYDRLLTPWFTEQVGPYPIGFAHDCQYVDSLATQAWDVPLPEVITPQQHFHFTQNNNALLI